MAPRSPARPLQLSSPAMSPNCFQILPSPPGHRSLSPVLRVVNHSFFVGRCRRRHERTLGGSWSGWGDGICTLKPKRVALLSVRAPRAHTAVSAWEGGRDVFFSHLSPRTLLVTQTLTPPLPGRAKLNIAQSTAKIFTRKLIILNWQEL